MSSIFITGSTKKAMISAGSWREDVLFPSKGWDLYIQTVTLILAALRGGFGGVKARWRLLPHPHSVICNECKWECRESEAVSWRLPPRSS